MPEGSMPIMTSTPPAGAAPPPGPQAPDPAPQPLPTPPPQSGPRPGGRPRGRAPPGPGSRPAGPARGAGEPVVLVHGNLSTGRFWQRVMTRLPDRYRVLAPDMRGFGDTDDVPLDATRGLADW